MTRLEDSPDLFGHGLGTSTQNLITCEWCQRTYNDDADADIPREELDQVLHTTFAGRTVCSCCFGRVEHEVLTRMADILPWYHRHLTQVRAKADAEAAALTELKYLALSPEEKAKILADADQRHAEFLAQPFGRSEWLDLLMRCQDGQATCLYVLKKIEAELDRVTTSHAQAK